jgi:L-iditol 2-dehydrogenase
MQAVVFPEPDEVELRNVERPEPGAGEALVRVQSSTICGSDIKILHGEYGATEYPHIPGHEWAGEVVEVGDDVQRFAPGDRVAAEPHVGCGECPRCMEGLYNLCEHYGEADYGHAHIGFTSNGGLAEYVAVDTRALHTLGSMTYDQGAFCEAVGVALHAIERAGIDGGDDVVVIGPGAIGLCAVQIARHGGADKVILTGTRQERLEPASAMGADHTVNVHEVDDVVDHVTRLLDGRRADLVVELAGTETASRQAVEMARRGGSVVLAGSTSAGRELTIDLREIVVGHKNIHGSVANPKWICERGLSMVERGTIDVDPLLTHRFALSEFEDALDAFEQREGGAFRVMLYPGQDPEQIEPTAIQRR